MNLWKVLKCVFLPVLYLVFLLPIILFPVSIRAADYCIRVCGPDAGSVAPAPTPGPTPDPTPVPGPTPPPSGCAPGEVFGGQDATFIPFGGQAFPANPLPASGNTGNGRAVKFVADSVNFPNGVTLALFDQSVNGTAKDIVISVCPHSFSAPVSGNQYCARSNIGTNAGVPLRFGPATVFYDCALTPGETYYLNFRGTDSDSVSAQILLQPR